MTQYKACIDERRSFEPKTPAAKAAIDFIIAVDTGETPNREMLELVRDVLLAILSAGEAKQAGRVAKEAFGLSQGGRPRTSGFSMSEIVSAFIEREKRRLGGGRGTITQAQREACAAFVELARTKEDKSRMRTIERHWKNGRGTIEHLSDNALEEILRPHQIPTKNL